MGAFSRRGRGDGAWFVAGCLAAWGCGARTGLEVGADPDAGPVVPELCNGLDDDGDGLVDEDVPPVECGSGACRNEARCESGRFPPCVPLPGSPESCNGLDDDCDGDVDEDLGFGAVGATVEIREGLGRAGDCATCAWAWDTTIAPVEAGYLVLYRLGIYGGREEPNLYGRRLTRDLEPLGPPELVASDVVLDLREMSTDVPEEDTLLDATLRVGSSDVPGWVRVSADGAVEVARRPYDIHESCRAAASGETVWTGDRLVSVCWAEGAVQVVSARRDGSDARDEAYPWDGAYGGDVAVRGGFVGVRTYGFLDGGATRSVAFLLLGGLGEHLVGPRAVDLDYASWARLVGADEGWLYWATDRSPTLAQVLTREGDPLTDPAPFPDLRRMADSPLQDVQVPHPVAPVVVNVWQSPWGEPDPDLHVEHLGSRGEVLRSWHGPPSDGVEGDAVVVSPHAVVDGERVVVTWHGLAGDYGANRVYVRAFGCVD